MKRKPPQAGILWCRTFSSNTLLSQKIKSN
jgi:hypothetical protein